MAPSWRLVDLCAHLGDAILIGRTAWRPDAQPAAPARPRGTQSTSPSRTRSVHANLPAREAEHIGLAGRRTAIVAYSSSAGAHSAAARPIVRNVTFFSRFPAPFPEPEADARAGKICGAWLIFRKRRRSATWIRLTISQDSEADSGEWRWSAGAPAVPFTVPLRRRGPPQHDLRPSPSARFGRCGRPCRSGRWRA